MASITWSQFQPVLSTVTAFQDPVYETHVNTEHFISIYREILESLDGQDSASYVDFYFEPSPINTSVYLFVDEDAKLDFRDFAYEKGLIPDMKEIIESESAAEKHARNNKPTATPKKSSIKKNPNPNSHPNPHPKHKAYPLNKSFLQERKVQETLDKLQQRLQHENDPTTIKCIQEKIIRTKSHLTKYNL